MVVHIPVFSGWGRGPLNLAENRFCDRFPYRPTIMLVCLEGSVNWVVKNALWDGHTQFHSFFLVVWRKNLAREGYT